MLQIQKKLTNSFFLLLSLPATAMGFALCVQISALSWIMTTKYGLDVHEVGIVWLGGPLAGMIGQVVFGLISDNVWFWGGRRRPFILIGGTVAALMLLCLPFLGDIANKLGFENILPLAVFVALTLDLAINISFNPTRSVVADVTPEGETRTKGFTWMQTISGFFGVLAYFIGAEFGNYNLIYLGVCLVLTFSIIPTFFIKEPRQLVQNKENETRSESKVKNLHSGSLWMLYFAHGFTWLGIQTMFVYMVFFIRPLLFGNVDPDSLTDSQNNEMGVLIGYSFLVLNTIGFIFPKFVLEPITHLIGRVKTHAISIAVMSCAYFAIWIFVQDRYMLYAFMAVAGVGWASAVSLPFAIFSDMVDQRKMGMYMGMFNLSVVVPQLFVSLVVGLLIQQLPSENQMFAFCGICLAVSAGLWLLVREKE